MIPLFLLTVLLSPGCQGKGDQADMTNERLRDAVARGTLEKLSARRIFFGHQSVGFNILDGVDTLGRETPGAGLRIVETGDPSAFDAPVLAHARVGKNGNPEAKIAAFGRYLDSGIGNRADIALFKFCYVDFKPGTDPDKVFEAYREAVRSWKERYPGLVFVHVTVPLTTFDTRMATRLKGLAARLLGKTDPNVVQDRMNERIRKEYGGRDPVFDLAAIESATPAGNPVTIRSGGRNYPTLYPGYTTDGGHLNDLGKRVVAGRLLEFLAGIPARAK